MHLITSGVSNYPHLCVRITLCPSDLRTAEIFQNKFTEFCFLLGNAGLWEQMNITIWRVRMLSQTSKISFRARIQVRLDSILCRWIISKLFFVFLSEYFQGKQSTFWETWDLLVLINPKQKPIRIKSLLATVLSLSLDVQTEYIAFFSTRRIISYQQTAITGFHAFVGIRFFMIKNNWNNFNSRSEIKFIFRAMPLYDYLPIHIPFHDEITGSSCADSITNLNCELLNSN